MNGISLWPGRYRQKILSYTSGAFKPALRCVSSRNRMTVEQPAMPICRFPCTAHDQSALPWVIFAAQGALYQPVGTPWEDTQTTCLLSPFLGGWKNQTMQETEPLQAS
ncbi:hypothetical protein CIB84_002302, partial [Bambusicola thoracicus]